MDFWFDVIDWLGGCPYEYAATQEVIAHLQDTQFEARKVIPAEVPTGCNEFVFRRIKTNAGI
jgi:2-polyprenyl-6-hydroxyphenyl methylase/3-demethylubiquinone-9 3-methyltransferase